jgi:nucleotide-binding universal stress UspA family protein
MYRNVMVPVDGSSFAREAVFEGLRIASQSGAALRLVRVAVSPLNAGPVESVAVESERMRQVHASELAELYALAAECRAYSTVNVTASLERGPVADALMGYARRHAVDLIVMRSHARHGLSRVWFGSTADALIRESGIPVLVVRPSSVGTAVKSGTRFKRIIVALDGSTLAERALAPAVALARLEGATITLLRVVSSWKQIHDGELAAAAGPASAIAVDAAQMYLDGLSRHYTGVTMKRRVVIAEDVAQAILRAAASEEADMIAIATRGRGAVKRAASGSVADVVMREAVVSALVIHPDRVSRTEVASRAASLAPARAGQA